MNNFPAMTEAQRQELIEELQEVIKLEIHSVYGYAARIALAALTAEPEGYKVRHHHEPDGSGTRIGADMLGYFKARGDYHYTSTYTAPPAPVLKPIKLNGDDVDTPIDWYAGAKTRDMVIDVIRAAGYEVIDTAPLYSKPEE